MSVKITAEENKNRHYRHLVLEDKLRTLGNMINGRGSSFAPFITDEGGKVSDKKVDRFISDLINCYKHECEISGSPLPDENKEEMYRSFLYCSIMTLKTKPNRRCPSAERTVVSESFADIIELAEHLHPYAHDCFYDSARMLGYNFPANDDSDLEEISYAESIQYEERMENDPDFRRNMEKLHEMSAENYLAEQERNKPLFEALDLLSEDESYKDNEMLADRSEKDLKEIEEKKAEQEMFDTIYNWRKNTVDGIKFFENLVKFSDLYFMDLEPPPLADDIKNMVDIFLYEHKLSAFSLEDSYINILYHIEEMKNRIRQEALKENGKMTLYKNKTDFYTDLWNDFRDPPEGDVSRCFYYCYLKEKKDIKAASIAASRQQLEEYGAEKGMDKYILLHGTYLAYAENHVITLSEYKDTLTDMLRSTKGSKKYLNELEKSIGALDENIPGDTAKAEAVIDEAREKYERQCLVYSVGDVFYNEGFKKKTANEDPKSRNLKEKNELKKYGYTDVFEIFDRFTDYRSEREGLLLDMQGIEAMKRSLKEA
ncbi:MAG: hypothetical protein J1F11_04945 [Oscillospiraceae bacterium]|nr:hypothetical protein [Oscillospiraceae bacterium]